MDAAFSIGELAEMAGVSRRAVRFYVSRGLLAPAGGVGRGRHYDRSHLETLKRIEQLQAAGHSLDAIALILRGQPPPPPQAVRRGRPPKARMLAQLWTRLSVAPGVELHVNATRHELDPEQLAAIQEAVRTAIGHGRRERNDDDDDAGGSGDDDDARPAETSS